MVEHDQFQAKKAYMGLVFLGLAGLPVREDKGDFRFDLAPPPRDRRLARRVGGEAVPQPADFWDRYGRAGALGGGVRLRVATLVTGLAAAWDAVGGKGTAALSWPIATRTRW